MQMRVKPSYYQIEEAWRGKWKNDRVGMDAEYPKYRAWRLLLAC
jgi:hypothetical protein